MGSGSVSVANAQTDFFASEMKRDPAFALAVSSLERCLKVRERVSSSLIVGRPGKPPGSGSLCAVSDSQGTFFAGASGACVDWGATMVTDLHETAGMHEGITGLLEVPESGRFMELHVTAGEN